LFTIETQENLGTIYAMEMKFTDSLKRANDLHLLKVEVLDNDYNYEFEFNGIVSVKNSTERFVRLILLEKNAEF
jgi:hypothetical protein